MKMQSNKLDLTFLTETEKAQILFVLERNDLLKKQHEAQLEILKKTYQNLEDEKLDIPKNLITQSKVCVICKSQCGRVINTSETCPTCLYKVCHKCREYLDTENILINNLTYNWICKVCSTKKQLLSRNGEWIYHTKNSLNKNDAPKLSVSDLIKKSLKDAEKAKIEEETKEQTRKLTILSNSSSHKPVNKSKSADFFSRSIQALKTSDTTLNLKKKFEGFLQNGKNTSKFSVFNSSANGEQRTVTPIISDNKVPLHSLFKENQNPRIVIQESNSPKLSTRSASKPIRKTPTITIEEGTDFGSVTSSDAEFTDNKEDHFLTQLHKIDYSSDENSNFNNKSEKKNSNFNQVVEPFNSINENHDVKSHLTVSEPTKLINNRQNDFTIESLSSMIIEIKNPQNTENQAIDKTSETDDRMINKNINEKQSSPILYDAFNEPTKIEKNAIAKDESKDSFRTIGTIGSTMSLRTDDIDTKIQIKGQIFLILSYNKKTSNLNIHVKRCQDLAIANIKKKTSDPYVKFYLLPDKNKSDKRKTSIQRNNCNPVYDEELRYTLSTEKLKISTLFASVWHHDMFGHNKFLGEAKIPLILYELENFEPKEQTFDLVNHEFSKHPTLFFDLKFEEGKNKMGILNLFVKNAMNLVPLKENQKLDTFVDAILIPDDKSKKSDRKEKKIDLIKNNLNPDFNKNFMWSNMNREDLRDKSLEIYVYAQDSSKKLIGGISLNTKKINKIEEASDKESSIWLQVIEEKNSKRFPTFEVELGNISKRD